MLARMGTADSRSKRKVAVLVKLARWWWWARFAGQIRTLPDEDGRCELVNGGAI
jgi:hypothetical protein